MDIVPSHSDNCNLLREPWRQRNPPLGKRLLYLSNTNRSLERDKVIHTSAAAAMRVAALGASLLRRGKKSASDNAKHDMIAFGTVGLFRVKQGRFERVTHAGGSVGRKRQYVSCSSKLPGGLGCCARGRDAHALPRMQVSQQDRVERHANLMEEKSVFFLRHLFALLRSSSRGKHSILGSLDTFAPHCIGQSHARAARAAIFFFSSFHRRRTARGAFANVTRQLGHDVYAW